jgi:hypothetical protein
LKKTLKKHISKKPTFEKLKKTSFKLEKTHFSKYLKKNFLHFEKLSKIFHKLKNFGTLKNKVQNLKNEFF